MGLRSPVVCGLSEVAGGDIGRNREPERKREVHRILAGSANDLGSGRLLRCLTFTRPLLLGTVRNALEEFIGAVDLLG